MESLVQIAMMAFAVIGAGWFMYLVGSHGWSWVAAKIKARAAAAEADIKAKAAQLGLPDRVAKIEADLAALKAKVP